MGFGIPQADWLREDLFDLVKMKLCNEESFISHWINMEELRNTVLMHKRGANQDRMIWPLLILELWAENWL
jgi:hypothetical protein